MTDRLERFALKCLSVLEPERAHALALAGLRLLPRPAWSPDDPRLRVRAFGLEFPNPIGTAAGFDKNGEVLDAVLNAGFGFAEVGTVTPHPQPGNPRPRLFRLDGDFAVINRLGFNNQGHGALQRRMLARRSPGIVGVNIGANKDTTDRIDDYIAGLKAFCASASYLTVNVSSPNTPGLRDLQQAAMLDELLARLIDARSQSASRPPVLLKIAPDLTLAGLDDIIAVARRRGIDGLIVSNTTISRPSGLREYRYTREAGGLSGRPLFPLATRVLAECFIRVENAFPLIGVGGIDSGEAALDKIRAGATLIQLYTGLVFRGLGLLREVKSHLVTTVTTAGEQNLSAFVGRDAAVRTAEPWPQ